MAITQFYTSYHPALPPARRISRKRPSIAQPLMERPWPDTPARVATIKITMLRCQFPAKAVRLKTMPMPDAHGLAELRWLHQALDKAIAWRRGWRKIDKKIVSTGKSHPLFS